MPKYRTDNITEGFRKAKFCIPEALVVIINSPGGSLAQAKHISDVIKNYSAKNKYNVLYLVSQYTALQKTNVWEVQI